MLMEELFMNGTMIMGPSRTDPNREVGVLAPSVLAGFADRRAAELERFNWIAGTWSYENVVPPTRVSPAYRDTGTLRFALDGGWVCTVADGGARTRWVTLTL